MNLKTIANDILPVYENQSGEKLVDARELHSNLMINTRFNDWISRQISNYGFTEKEDFYSFLSKSSGRPAREYLLTMDTAKEIAMIQNNEMGRVIRKYFIEVEKRFRQQQPKSVEDLIIMQAQSMKELKQTVEEHDRQIETVNHRLDNIDKIDTLGDLQQRLNKMIQRLAQQEGWSFAKSWREFRAAYNTAFRTNLKAKMNNYREKHGLKSLTIPQYFSLTDQLKDAVRIADKLLNSKENAI